MAWTAQEMADFWENTLTAGLSIGSWIVAWLVAMRVLRAQLRAEREARALDETNDVIYFPLRLQLVRVDEEKGRLELAHPMDALNQNFTPKLKEGRLLTPIHRALRADIDQLEALGTAHKRSREEYVEATRVGVDAAIGALEVEFSVPMPLPYLKEGGPVRPHFTPSKRALGELAREYKVRTSSQDFTTILHQRDFAAFKLQVRQAAQSVIQYSPGADSGNLVMPDDATLRAAFESAIAAVADHRTGYMEKGMALVSHAESMRARLDQAIETGDYYGRHSAKP